MAVVIHNHNVVSTWEKLAGRSIRAMLIMSPHVLCFDKHVPLRVGSYHSTNPDAG